MATKMYEASFASVIPQLRFKENILADVQKAGSGKATDASKAQIAMIELHIKNGEEFYRQNQYNAALQQFKQARASIYKILYPNFDIRASIGRKDVILPVSKLLEDNLIDTSVKIGEIIKPFAAEDQTVYPFIHNGMPDYLKAYTVTGFKEESKIEEFVETASARAVALLQDEKPEAAISIMEKVLEEVSTSNQKLNPELEGALQLNLAAAYIQTNNTEKASALANASLKNFQFLKDSTGQAQALHIMGVSASKTGDSAKSQEFLNQASVLIGSKPSVTIGRSLGAQAGNKEIGLNVLSNKLSIGQAIPVMNVTSKNSSSRKVEDLTAISEKDTHLITYRIPGSIDSWGDIEIADVKQKSKNWTVGILAGGEVFSIPLGVEAVTREKVVGSLYAKRITQEVYESIDFKIVDISSTTYYITHIYSYVLPVKIGDCYHALGKYKNAEDYYNQATQYTYLNKNIEATLLWIKIARNAFEWGSSLYMQEKLPEAKIQYSKLINDDGTIPAASLLYNLEPLKIPVDIAKFLITNILTRPLPIVNWEVSYYILSASGFLQQIFDGLDYYGLALSPIHTFEYLQSVSRGFAQEAIQAEREFINFKSTEEMEEGSRRELETAKAMAEAEAQGRYQQYISAMEDEAAAKGAHELAIKRRDDATVQKGNYAATTSAQIWAQAASQALGGGQDGLYAEISELADKLDRGETIHGPGPKLAAAETLSAGRKTMKYELQKMQDNIDELTQAVTIAKDQWDSAKSRTNANEISWQASLKRSEMAAEALTAFDDEFFTPEAWSKMADVMRSISRGYLYRAIRIAKLMERSYNFENDFQLKIIKNNYGFAVGNESSGEDTRLLGGDSLLLDIESFTYHAITNKTRKTSRIKDIISLATDFPAHFEEFKNTGTLKFETDLYEFDRLHPGFYGQRIEAVELEIVGLLSSSGLNGTLTAGGVTTYRKKDGTTEKRVHQVDTMALSDFELRNDIFLYSTETGVRGLFQGLGIGSTWTLNLPRRSNDIDFKRIFDVNLIIYYTAKFDPILRTTMLAKPPRPGEFSLIRNFGLRYDFPDAWYGFYQGGFVAFNIERLRLPMNQQNFAVELVNFRVVTKQGISNAGLKLKITAPSGASGTLVTDAIGAISSSDPALAALAGGNPVGIWSVVVSEGASLMDGDKIKYDRIYNIQLGLEYTFQYLPENI